MRLNVEVGGEQDMSLARWIQEDWERWRAICGVGERVLSMEEALNIIEEILKMKPFDPEFMGVIYILTTRYPK